MLIHVRSLFSLSCLLRARARSQSCWAFFSCSVYDYFYSIQLTYLTIVSALAGGRTGADVYSFTHVGLSHLLHSIGWFTFCRLPVSLRFVAFIAFHRLVYILSSASFTTICRKQAAYFQPFFFLFRYDTGWFFF
jgi:hypothetical protein